MDDARIDFGEEDELLASANRLIRDALEDLGFTDVEFVRYGPRESLGSDVAEDANLVYSSIVLRRFDDLGPDFYRGLLAKRLSKSDGFVTFHDLYNSIALDSTRETYNAPIKMQRYQVPDPVLVAVLADFMERDGVLEYSTQAKVCSDCGAASGISYRLTDRGRFWLSEPPIEEKFKN